MAFDLAHLKSLPGIFKLVTIVLGFLAFVISIVANGSRWNKDEREYKKQLALQDRKAEVRSAPRTILGLVRTGDDVKCEFEDLPKEIYQQIAIVIIFFCMAISIADVVFHCLMPITPILKLGDTIYHAVGGLLIIIAGSLLLAHISYLNDCANKRCDRAKEIRKQNKLQNNIPPEAVEKAISQFYDDCIETSKDLLKYSTAVTAGVFCLFLALVYIAVAVILCMTPAPGGGQSMAQQMGMRDNALSRMINQTPSQAQAQNAQASAAAPPTEEKVEGEAPPAQA